MRSGSDGCWVDVEVEGSVKLVKVLVVGEHPPVLVHQGRHLAPHRDQDGVLVLPQLGQEVPS